MHWTFLDIICLMCMWEQKSPTAEYEFDVMSYCALFAFYLLCERQLKYEWVP